SIIDRTVTLEDRHAPRAAQKRQHPWYSPRRAVFRRLFGGLVFIDPHVTITAIDRAMAVMHEKLSETHIVGSETRQQLVRAEDCPALAQRMISHVGVGDAAPPYRIVRTHLSGAYLHACLGGEGKMLLDGRWRAHR